MRRPTVRVNCVADRHHAPAERIIEFSDHTGAGGLISFSTSSTGTLIVDVYRTDANVRVVSPRVPRPRRGDA